MQADRRRLNGPVGDTAPPVFATPPNRKVQRSIRSRKPDEHRKIFLRTGIVPSASGSAYYEVPPQTPSQQDELLISQSSSLKITCTVHGPRPLPRNAAFSPNLLLTTHVKFAPFATRNRRGYVRDASERDLGVHLETALRGVIIGERWPKSGCEVVITVLEGEEDAWWGDAGNEQDGGKAALVDAGIDCVDMVSGGVAAVVQQGSADEKMDREVVLIDPTPSEHYGIKAACVVGYLQSRDEVTEMWMKGDAGTHAEALVEGAVKAASLARTVLAEAIKESVALRSGESHDNAHSNGSAKAEKTKQKDVVMTG
ncbi:3'-5'-exoribonuclease [Recurvomyces mirabilis]|nr:3'-5'-exoribonuclease [Recurvomyces mirabilis]